MDPTSAQQSSLLKEGPVVVKAKAHSVRPVTQAGVDSQDEPSPSGASPMAGRMKNCVGFCVLHLLLQSPAVTHHIFQVSIGTIKDSYVVEPQRVLI